MLPIELYVNPKSDLNSFVTNFGVVCFTFCCIANRILLVLKASLYFFALRYYPVIFNSTGKRSSRFPLLVVSINSRIYFTFINAVKAS